MSSIISQFNSSHTHNWELQSGYTTRDGSTANTSPPVHYNYNTGTVTTTFDSQGWKQATDLSWARTILYESVHAKLATKFALDKPNFAGNYPDMVTDYHNWGNWNGTYHEHMAETIVDQVATSLEEFRRNRGYSYLTQYYKDLAWGGLHNTTQFKNKSASEQKRILDTLAVAATGIDTDGSLQP